jgi:hypothetical protein
MFIPLSPDTLICVIWMPKIFCFSKRVHGSIHQYETSRPRKQNLSLAQTQTLTFSDYEKDLTNNKTRRGLCHSLLLPEKLTSPQLLKKFPSLYGTRRFIIAFTIVMTLPSIIFKPLARPTCDRASCISGWNIYLFGHVITMDRRIKLCDSRSQLSQYTSMLITVAVTKEFSQLNTQLTVRFTDTWL